MRRKRKSTVTRSGGNVFRDLGFPAQEAEHLLVRSDLMIRIEKEIRARDLTQAEAARRLGVSQPRVSDLMRGRLDLFSTDALIDMLGRLGLRVRVVTAGRSRVA
jgi:predicted XRE-type DNA-binding protein